MKERLNLLSLSISTGSYEDITQNILTLAQQKTSSYTCVANVHMLVEAYKHKDFARIVNQADITTPDGKPIIWGLKLIHRQEQARVAGMDLLPSLLQGAANLRVPVYFLGGTEEMLRETRSFLKIHYPDLVVAGTFSPPFRTLTRAEEEAIIQDINESNAGLLLVAMGCPKQEKWMGAMKGRISASMVGIGGALPVMIGQQKRAPVWMQNAGLEWAYRLGQEPRRLFKRYAVTNTIFIWLLGRQYITYKCFLGQQIKDFTGLN